jgi:hypothetical protein
MLLALVSVLGAACPPASWPGWVGWIDAHSPLADKAYGGPMAYGQRANMDGALWGGSWPHGPWTLGPMGFIIEPALVAQLASVETWLDLARDDERSVSCRMFDRVLDRLQRRDDATRVWCDSNRASANTWLDANQPIKTVQCVCSADVARAWEKCQKQEWTGPGQCDERSFILWFNKHRGKRCEVIVSLVFNECSQQR